MVHNNTVVLAGGTELTAFDNIRELENAGYMVVTALNLDYALAANELFEPNVIVLDIDQMSGDIKAFLRSLFDKPRYPFIYLLSVGKRKKYNKLLLTNQSEYLKKPLSATELTARINSMIT